MMHLYSTFTYQINTSWCYASRCNNTKVYARENSCFFSSTIEHSVFLLVFTTSAFLFASLKQAVTLAEPAEARACKHRSLSRCSRIPQCGCSLKSLRLFILRRQSLLSVTPSPITKTGTINVRLAC